VDAPFWPEALLHILQELVRQSISLSAPALASVLGAAAFAAEDRLVMGDNRRVFSFN